jgi:hypothetical protein
MIPLLTADGGLTPAVRLVLGQVTGVPEDLLAACRVRRRSGNLLHAPWYPASRGGGAMVLGRTIYFTPNWFAPSGVNARGDGSLDSALRWLLHLAHEVGHLPQARRHGTSAWGQARYVAAFAGQYLWRAVRLKPDVHDGAPLEQEAEIGAAVLRRLIGAQGMQHPLVVGVHRNDLQAVSSWLEAHRGVLAEAVRGARSGAQRKA